jgi:hypothetical protein
MCERYQFCVDGRPIGPVRDSWLAAARDAVTSGMGVWSVDRQHNQVVKLDDSLGAEIVRVDRTDR